MEINTYVIIAVVICSIGLILYLIFQNRKDEKDLVKTLNADDVVDEKPKNEDD